MTLKRNTMFDKANISRFDPTRLADIARLTHLACEGCFCCSRGDVTQAAAYHPTSVESLWPGPTPRQCPKRKHDARQSQKRLHRLIWRTESRVSPIACREG